MIPACPYHGREFVCRVHDLDGAAVWSCLRITWPLGRGVFCRWETPA